MEAKSKAVLWLSCAVSALLSPLLWGMALDVAIVQLLQQQPTWLDRWPLYLRGLIAIFGLSVAGSVVLELRRLKFSVDVFGCRLQAVGAVFKG